MFTVAEMRQSCEYKETDSINTIQSSLKSHPFVGNPPLAWQILLSLFILEQILLLKKDEEIQR